MSMLSQAQFHPAEPNRRSSGGGQVPTPNGGRPSESGEAKYGVLDGMRTAAQWRGIAGEGMKRR